MATLALTKPTYVPRISHALIAAADFMKVKEITLAEGIDTLTVRSNPLNAYDSNANVNGTRVIVYTDQSFSDGDAMASPTGDALEGLVILQPGDSMIFQPHLNTVRTRLPKFFIAAFEDSSGGGTSPTQTIVELIVS